MGSFAGDQNEGEEFERKDKEDGEDRRNARDRKRARDEFPDKDDDEDKDGEDEFPDKEKDDDEDGEDAAHDRRSAKDGKRGAKDKAMDSKRQPITQDEVNKMISDARMQERRRAKAANDAREFVRPYVGTVSMALDSAETILRAGARALEIENADKLHVDALRPLIKVYGQRRTAGNREQFEELAMDSSTDDGVSTFNEMFGADRVKSV